MKTNDLTKAIKKILPATSKKGIVAGWDTLVILNGELIAFNDKICVSILLEGIDDIECAVKADELSKALKTISEEEVTLSADKKKFTILSDTTELELEIYDTVDVILDMVEKIQIDHKTMNKLPANFNRAINLCKFAVSDNFNDAKTLYALKVIDNYVYSSDRSRMSKFALSSDIDSFLLPKNVLNELGDFEPTHYKFKDNWAHFKNADQALFSCRVVTEDNFPDCESIISGVKCETIVKLPEKFKEELDKSLVIFDEAVSSKKHVRVEIKDGELVFSIDKKIKLTKSIKIEDKEVKTNFLISASFLSDILDLTDEIHVNEKFAIFKDEEFEHLIILIPED